VLYLPLNTSHFMLHFFYKLVVVLVQATMSHRLLLKLCYTMVYMCGRFKRLRTQSIKQTLWYKPVISHFTCRISFLLTLILSFTSDSHNNNDILLVVGHNCNLFTVIVKNFRAVALGLRFCKIVYSPDLTGYNKFPLNQRIS